MIRNYFDAGKIIIATLVADRIFPPFDFNRDAGQQNAIGREADGTGTFGEFRCIDGHRRGGSSV